jgi:hypothetical protein
MMSDTHSLLGRYAEAARAHGTATEKGDYKEANRKHAQLVAVLRELRSDERVGALAELLGHEEPYVRCWAATHLLESDATAAIPVLEDLVRRPGFLGFTAATVLKEWKKGTLAVEH